MLTEICRYLSNVYNIDSGDLGTYKIESDVLTGSEKIYAINSYICIEARTGANDGSLMNSGIYKVKDHLMTLDDTLDEEFTGRIYQLAIPKGLIKLAIEIEQNIKDTPQTSKKSESFGIYSYALATNKNGMVASWMEVYSERLNAFRNRMYLHVRI